MHLPTTPSTALPFKVTCCSQLSSVKDKFCYIGRDYTSLCELPFGDIRWLLSIWYINISSKHPWSPRWCAAQLKKPFLRWKVMGQLYSEPTVSFHIFCPLCTMNPCEPKFPPWGSSKCSVSDIFFYPCSSMVWKWGDMLNMIISGTGAQRSHPLLLK